MHDIFVAFIVSFFGNIYFIDVPMLLYRQHDSDKMRRQVSSLLLVMLAMGALATAANIAQTLSCVMDIIYMMKKTSSVLLESERIHF
ncbi:MAG: hypothetical protein K2J68_03800 [Treponemataceae bacterium]|nr:hypothetical protein [Treponemataceae bacterium]